jgi:hypothetical protein
MPKAIVLATANNKTYKNIETFLFYDKSGNTFASNSLITPWSPYTGMSAIRKDNNKIVLSSHKMSSKLHKLTDCPTCNAGILINKVAASDKKLQKHLFCPVCASDLHSDIPSGADNMTEVPESEDEAATNSMYPEIDNTNEMGMPISNELENSSTMDGDTEADADELMETVRKVYNPMMASKKSKKNKTSEKKNKTSEKKAKKSEKKSKKVVREDKIASKGPSREDATFTQRKEPAKINKPVDETYQADTGAPVTANVKNKVVKIDFGNIDYTKANLTIVPVSADKSYLFANENPALVLRASKAEPAIASLFSQPAKLLEALATTIHAGSFDMKKFGAKKITAKLALDAVVSKKIRATDRKLQAEFKAKIEELEKNYFNALSVAAVAVNKNTVEKHPNTLKASIIQAMKQNGVRNPEKIVDAAFSSEGESYLRSILGYARDFRNKSRTAQKEIAKFVASASYNATETTSNDIADHLAESGFNIASVSMNMHNNNEPEEFVAKASDKNTDVAYYSSLLRK